MGLLFPWGSGLLLGAWEASRLRKERNHGFADNSAFSSLGRVRLSYFAQFKTD